MEEERRVVFIRRSEGPPFITTIHLINATALKMYFKITNYITYSIFQNYFRKEEERMNNVFCKLFGDLRSPLVANEYDL